MPKNSLFDLSFLGSKFSPGVFWAPITPKMVLTGCQDIKTLGYKKFLELSPIEKKLVLPYQALRGRKFKMAATGRSYGGFLGNFSAVSGAFFFGKTRASEDDAKKK